MTNEKKEKVKKGRCIMHHAGDSEDPNLCCCYIMDADGGIEDPCYHPVTDCC